MTDAMHRTTLAVLVLLVTAACSPETAIKATIDGKEVEFESATATLKEIPSGYRLIVSGTRKDNDFSLQVNVEFAAALVDDLQEESTFDIDGTAVLQGEDVAYDANASQDIDVVRAWIGAVCSDCDNSPKLTQRLSGKLFFEERDDEEAVGTLNLDSFGALPGWTADDLKDVDAQFEITWAAPLPEPEPTTDGTDGGTATDAVDSTGGPPEPQPAAGVVILGPDTGIVFHTGEKTDPGNFKNSDVYATAGGAYLKLTPGGSKSTKSNPVNWFKGAGGFHSTFGALAEVPNKPPTDDKGTSLVNAKAGIGFVVGNNLSDGYTRAWIQESGGGSLVLEYEIAP